MAYGGPRLYRFYSYEAIDYVEAPVGGWNPDTHPWLLPANQAPVLDNFLIRPGKIVMRGKFTLGSDMSAFAPINMAGIAFGAKNFLVGRRAASGTAVTDPWDCVLALTTAATLARGTTQAIAGNRSAAAAGVAVTLDQVPGPRWINFDGLMYGLSYDASTAPVTYTDVNSNYVARATNLLTWPFTSTFPPPAPTAMLNAPRGAFDLKGYLQRIWLLGGVDIPGGLTAHESTTIYFTNPIVSGGGNVAADWKDPVSGLVNKIRLDQDIADYGVGLAATHNALLIFRKSSIWAVRGTTTANFAAQRVSAEVGCIDARSIVEMDNGVYFLSHRGLMLTDGVRVTNVSGTVERTLQLAIQTWWFGKTNGGSNFAPAYATLAPTSQGHLVVSLCYVNPNTGNISTVFSGMFDTTTNAWTRITSNVWSDETAQPAAGNYSNLYPGPMVWSRSPMRLMSIADKRLTAWEDLALLGQTFLEPSTANSNPLTTVVFYDDNGVAALPIPARWKSRYLPVIGTVTLARRFAIAKRLFVDYVMGASGSITGGLQLVTRDAQDNAIGSTKILPIQGAPLYKGPVSFGTVTPSPIIQRQNYDFANEIGDMCFDFSWPNANDAANFASGGGVAEIYGVGIEAQRTRDAR